MQRTQESQICNSENTEPSQRELALPQKTSYKAIEFKTVKATGIRMEVNGTEQSSEKNN